MLTADGRRTVCVQLRHGTDGPSVCEKCGLVVGRRPAIATTRIAGYFLPYLTYPMELEAGTLKMTFDLRWETGTLRALDCRDDPYDHNLGPNLTTSAEGWVFANGTRVVPLPEGKWVHLEFTCGLGPRTTGKYDLTLKLPDVEPQMHNDLACSPKSEFLNCIVFMAVADADAVFYIDNLGFQPSGAKTKGTG